MAEGGGEVTFLMWLIDTARMICGRSGTEV